MSHTESMRCILAQPKSQEERHPNEKIIIMMIGECDSFFFAIFFVILLVFNFNSTFKL